tara:strand:- start:203 stop:427 length:225 start_codon:yes stop_codon:yes gene_type:complete
MTDLTSEQNAELIEQYVEWQVDSMDMKDLICYVTEDMTDWLMTLTDKELEDEIVLTNEQDLYDQLVDNIRRAPK